MRGKRFLAASALMLAAWMMPLAAARAGTVLLDSSMVIQGAGSYVQSFDLATSGTLTFTLTSIPWLDPVTDLTGFLTTSAGVLGKSMGPGSESFKVTSGTVYAHWFGDAAGTFDAGVVGVKIVFQPGATPVPLPASLLLLLSALGVLFGWQGRDSLRIAAP
jgi:hypothetical protein